jgi:hypothetical protein
MKCKVTCLPLGLKDVVAEWDGKALVIPGPIQVQLGDQEIEGLTLSLEPSYGKCGCGRAGGVIFFPPMCEACWEEYADALSVTDHMEPGEGEGEAPLEETPS